MRETRSNFRTLSGVSQSKEQRLKVTIHANPPDNAQYRRSHYFTSDVIHRSFLCLTQGLVTWSRFSFRGVDVTTMYYSLNK